MTTATLPTKGAGKRVVLPPVKRSPPLGEDLRRREHEEQVCIDRREAEKLKRLRETMDHD